MAPASAADKAQLEGAFADAGRKLAGVEALEKQKDPKRRLAALKSAIDSFGTLKQTAMDLIPKATGISLGFNNLDGD
jgi:predicted lipoprotein